MVGIKENRPSEIIYQIYPSSFKDSNGDGIGDLKGITEKLDYIKSLNVDAIWISPFFETPEDVKKSDGGYAVSNYRKIDPKFGTMQDFENLLAEAHKRKIRVYTDFVMCHTSDEHGWFEKSCNREPEFADRYVWADGKNKDNRTPPNNWKSVFKDEHGNPRSAWTFNEKRGQFYLHHFNDSQPALNANEKHVQKAIIDEMKFWLDKGVDGLRLDALPYANYDPQLRDNPSLYNYDKATAPWACQWFEHSICQPQTIEYVARIREAFDEYQKKGLGKKTALGEAIAGRKGGLESMEVAATYVDAKKGLDSCYTEMQFWEYPSASGLKNKLKESLKYFPDGSMCNVLSNHDFSRAATRMMPKDCPEDLRPTVLKQLMAINLSLPGPACVYQGEELGFPDTNPPPKDRIKDVVEHGKRDPFRGLMLWCSSELNGGFSTAPEKKIYLPLQENYLSMAVDKQEPYRNSMLNFTRRLIKARKDNPALQVGATIILEENVPDPIFAFIRKSKEQTVLFVSNMGSHSKTIKPEEFLTDKVLQQLNLPKSEAMKQLNISPDETMTLGGYDFARCGLKTPEKEAQPSKKELENGHTGTKIFTVDFLLADIFHHANKAEQEHIIKTRNWRPSRRESIDKETHRELLSMAGGSKNVTIGGSALLTLDTLKKLQPDGKISIDYLGMVGNDESGNLIRDYLKKSGIHLLTPDGTGVETVVSHILATASGNIIATHVGNEAHELQKTLQNNPTLLESGIAKSDMVYLSGSLIGKFDKSLIEDILKFRWKHEKELVLALPVHADFGHDDVQFFQNLIHSANVVVGNDTEYCRIFGIKADHPATKEQMDIVTGKIMESFKKEILLKHDKPCSKYGQVAFITCGNQRALLVTKDKITEIPVAQVEKIGNSLGAGDVAAAAFLDAELRGLNHVQSAHFAMAMAAQKAGQQGECPYLLDVKAAQRQALFNKHVKGFSSDYRGNRELAYSGTRNR